MRVMVTGATGFLGRNVLDQMRLSGGIEVHGVYRSVTVPDIPGVIWHRADFLCLEDMAAVFDRSGPTHLLNLAWIGGEHLQDRYHSPLNTRWAAASQQVFESFASRGGERLVTAGSCLEYGGDPPPWTENAATRPDTPYGQGKLAASNAALQLQDVSVAVGRIFFTYGPYEDRRRLVPDVAISLLKGQSVSLSAGTQRRDYLHMADVSRALVGLLSHQGDGVYNIGAGVSRPVAEVATTIGRLLGREDLLHFGDRPPGGDTAADLAAVPTRLVNETGWSPQLDLETGLAAAVEWWRRELERTGELR